MTRSDDDPQRHALARVDYHLCGKCICSLWAHRNLPMPRTRAAIRQELRYWLACAKRAKQVMRSTVAC